jgi:LPXTG-motif cell wall-anchored protein
MLLASGAGLVAAAARGQVKTETTTTHGQPTQEVQVERGEVVRVSGNDLVVKMENGEIRDIPNVSEGARVVVDDKELGIHELKPGMHLHRTVTTTTTPRMVTTVQSVRGKIWQVTPPTSLILTLEDGTNQRFTIPQEQKFDVDGQMVDAWGLKKGMNITATKIVEVPETVVQREVKVIGKLPPAPPAPPPDVPILVVLLPRLAPPPATPTSEPVAQLPKTASEMPLLGLLGLGFLLLAVALRLLRHRRVLSRRTRLARTV